MTVSMALLGGRSGAQRRRWQVFAGLQINLKKIMAVDYRILIPH